MNDISYRLLLKNAQGLTLFGSMRYSIDYTQPVDPAHAAGVSGRSGTEASAATLLAQLQQQSTYELFPYRIDGAVTMPFVTGLLPVPTTGLALLSLLGPPVTFLMSSTNPGRNLFFQFNGLTNDNIAGGLAWRPGEPGELIFSALGTQLSTSA